MVSYVINGRKEIVGGSTEDAVMLYGNFEIKIATDINSLTNVGNYFKSDAVACTNVPLIAAGTTSKWRLRVEKGLGVDSEIILQTITMINGTEYKRIYDGNAWGDWKEIGSGGGGSAEYPTGGTIGQVLAKASSVDNDVRWQAPTYHFSTKEEMNSAIRAGLVPENNALITIDEDVVWSDTLTVVNGKLCITYETT